VTESKKIIFTLLCSIGTLAVTAYTWQNILLTIVLLSVFGLVTLFVERSKSAVIMYFTAFILGPLAEVWLIHAGAWEYTQPTLLGIPLWLPFLWGNASLTLNRINIYLQSVFKK